ncbi:F0F1 ATP synthase subunit B [Oscillatoria sp. CS-180]|uniref:F0F1 ATP synthase subunit B n=1 Tax=Oscillatoria sp. CS-180 TaxID=3021720 RepID=UPI002330FAB9|nr:F0F1 ATP synthase subunit B [Oscillatoria sp. CS-180]MDB9525833.1 F0F1 ATP synthase subunit B [Oscillatoria sp. CS-180]
MISLWLLATEEGGYGFNFDILETNLINLVIIWGVLFYFGSKFLGNTLSSRRASIEEAIQDAERRQREATKALDEQNKNLAQAQSKAQEIVQTAKQNASKAREDILAQSKTDIERMRAAADQDVSFQQERVMRELRQRIAQLAMERAENELPSRLTPEVQNSLVDKSIALLED